VFVSFQRQGIEQRLCDPVVLYSSQSKLIPFHYIVILFGALNDNMWLILRESYEDSVVGRTSIRYRYHQTLWPYHICRRYTSNSTAEIGSRKSQGYWLPSSSFALDDFSRLDHSHFRWAPRVPCSMTSSSSTWSKTWLLRSSLQNNMLMLCLASRLLEILCLLQLPLPRCLWHPCY